MSDELVKLWVYLAADPLLWLTLTLVAYQGGLWLHRRYGGNPLLNPVLIAVLLLVASCWAPASQYRDYFDGAQFVHFLLGPATVALAVPLFRQLASVRRALPALLVALVAGSLTAAGSAVVIGWALGGGSADLAVAGAEIGHDAHRHGRGGADRRPAVADGGAGDPDRHRRRGDRHGDAQSDRREGLAGAGVRRRHRGAWHRHGARFPGASDRRRLCGTGDGIQRAADGGALPMLLRVF